VTNSIAGEDKTQSAAIIFASIVEAKPFLEAVPSEQIGGNPFMKWKFHIPETNLEGWVAVCGVGKVAAAIAAQRFIAMYGPSVIINAGVCGAASSGSLIGDVYRITEAVEGDLMPEYSKPQACWAGSWEHLPEARLITRDMPVYHMTPDERNSSKQIEVVDMEGAAIARCCNFNRTPCVLLKGVTDFADAEARESIKKTAKMVSRRIADILLEGLER